uniref:Uncharacterized protein n=1 Tax=Romanomermis culicivorax TaxID=13658 RepID=A0A915L521_ROMCU
NLEVENAKFSLRIGRAEYFYLPRTRASSLRIKRGMDELITELKCEIRGILLSAAHDGVKLEELERDYA